MIDAIPVLTIAAAAVVAWVLCFMNKRVFPLWKVVAPFAVIWITAWLVSQLLSGNALQPVAFSEIKIDWLTLGLALLPVLAWPIRKTKEAPGYPVALA